MVLEQLRESLEGIGENIKEKTGEVNKGALAAVVIGVLIVAAGAYLFLPKQAGLAQARSSERIVQVLGNNQVVEAVIAACNCPTDYSPICGQDDRTYWNECFLTCLGGNSDFGGACSVSTYAFAEAGEGATCGVSGNEYVKCAEGLECIDSKCTAVDGVNCNGKIVSLSEYNANPAQCTRTGDCGSNINPVCADGQFTYANVCEAEKSGYTRNRLTSGACTGPTQGQECGITYVYFQGSKQLTWRDPQACDGTLACNNGVCTTSASYCPDGRRLNNPLSFAEECYPVQINTVTTGGETCPATVSCQPTGTSCNDPDGFNPEIQSTTTGTDSQGTEAGGTDNCITTNNIEYVEEYYCATEQSTSGTRTYVTKVPIKCDGKCMDGACTSSSAKKPSCQDNEQTSANNLFDKNYKGTINAIVVKNNQAIGVTVSDSCTSSKTSSQTTNTISTAHSSIANVQAIRSPTTQYAATGESVLEAYCLGTSVQYTVLPCETGEKCIDGKCAAIPPASTLTSQTACTDNDQGTNGGNPAVSGTITITTTLSNGGTVQQTSSADIPDKCADLNKVTQYYCKDATSWDKAISPCPTGTLCSDGTCKTVPSEINNICTDSDGADSKTQGIVTTGKMNTESASPTIYTDACASGTTVTEYTCNNNVMAQTVQNCLSGEKCLNGACIVTGTSYSPSCTEGTSGTKSGKGTSTVTAKFPDGRVEVKKDSCIDANTLVNWYCDGKELKSGLQQCTGEEACISDKCYPYSVAGKTISAAIEGNNLGIAGLNYLTS